MKYNGVADPGQLAMLKRVLINHCDKAGILPDTFEREQVAAVIMALYESGIAEEHSLTTALSMQRLPRPGL